MIRNFSLLVLALLLSLSGAEIAVRALTVFPITYESNQLPHDTLLYVLAPALSDVDDWGFRNPELGAQYDIVAIGDSHTFGWNVEWESSWPIQLSRIVGKSAYNMALGGWGIYQYAGSFERALRLRPRHIIVGLYPGNDLANCEVFQLPYWQERAAREGLNWRACEGYRKESDRSRRGWDRLKLAIRKTALGSLVYIVVWPQVMPLDAHNFEHGDQVLSVPKNHVSWHAAVANLDRPSVQDAYANSLTLLEGMRRRATEGGAVLAVLIIPSTERVVWHWAQMNGVELTEEFDRAVEHEIALARRYREQLTNMGIPVADATAGQSRLLDSLGGRLSEVYARGNSHPRKNGYRVYAEAAAPLITEVP